MKAVRERLGKGLQISVRGKVPLTQKLIERGMRFRELSEAEFATLYTVGDEVQASTNKGMTVRFCKRYDGVECVVKRRDRSNSFKRSADEKDWLSTTVFQANLPVTETLCQLFDLIVTPESYYVVMEKVEGMDLFELMSRERLNQPDTREIVFQILEALRDMHEMGKIHKDLKLENVMCDMDAVKLPSSPGGRMIAVASTASNSETPRCRSSWNRLLPGNRSSTKELSPSSPPISPKVKLIDFDTVETWEPDTPNRSRDVLGTDGYIAPEAYAGQYSPASDLYCVGVIMYKLITRKFPLNPDIFDDKPGENWVGSPAMQRIMERLKDEKVDFTKRPLDKMPDAANLCESLLAYDPANRPSARQALGHPWFQMRLDAEPSRASTSSNGTPKASS